VLQFLARTRAPQRVIRLTEAVVDIVNRAAIPVTFIYERFDPDPILSVVPQHKRPLYIAIWEHRTVLHVANIPWVKRSLWERLRHVP
jgi:hypothetical protein